MRLHVAIKQDDMDYDDEALEGERKGKAVDGLLEDLEECQRHTETIEDRLIALGFDMRLLESDYPALAAEEPTSQIEDCRDSAEVVG